jgi:hypothetical protein
LKLVDWNFKYDDKEDIKMTRYEWDTIWKFVDANVEAMKAAMDSLSDREEATATCSIESNGDETCSTATDLASDIFYDRLEYEWDDLPYAQDTCFFGAWMKKYKKTYPVIEQVQTMYQALEFKEHPGADDICMELDKIVQVRILCCLIGLLLCYVLKVSQHAYFPLPFRISNNRFAAIIGPIIMST